MRFLEEKNGGQSSPRNNEKCKNYINIVVGSNILEEWSQLRYIQVTGRKRLGRIRSGSQDNGNMF
jgi:hypothetical protein